MKILFRVDSGDHIGTGHIMRSLTLASAFKKQGHEALFLSREHKGNMNSYVSKFFDLEILPGSVQEKLKEEEKDDYSKWLGVELETEIRQVKEILLKNGCDLLVIDHYALNESFQKEVEASKTLVIDDIFESNYDCDYLLNQNLNAHQELYRGKLSRAQTKLMMGLDYALLRPEFSLLRPQSYKKIQKLSRVLAFFGGSDVTGESLKLTHAFLKLNPGFSLTILLSKEHPDYLKIERLSLENHQLKLIERAPEMASFLQGFDFCFGASGSTCWERATLGIPSALIVSAQNQKPIMEALLQKKAALFVGDGRKTDENQWVEFLEKNLELDVINKIGQNSYQLCDGLGCQRVVSEVMNA